MLSFRNPDNLDARWEVGDRPRKRKAIVVVFEEVDGELSVSFSDDEGGTNVTSGAVMVLLLMEMLRDIMSVRTT